MKRPSRLKTLRELSTPEERLQASCDQLNKEKDTERGQVAVKFVTEWITVQSLNELSRDNRALYAEVSRTAKSHLDMSENKKYGGWRSYLPTHEIEDPHGFAMWIIFFLIDNPLAEKLAGPCARCGDFFIKKRASQNVYCSRKCGNAATAVVRRREQMKEERQAKLLLVRAALGQWSKTLTNEGWKHWVANKAGVDLRFITQAVTKGDIMPPTLTKPATTALQRKVNRRIV